MHGHKHRRGSIRPAFVFPDSERPHFNNASAACWCLSVIIHTTSAAVHLPAPSRRLATIH
jgi:hypothetical protein